MGDTAFDSDTAVLFFGQVVHRREPFLDLAWPAHLAGRKKNPLGKRRLSGIHMGKNRDISNGLQHLRFNVENVRPLRLKGRHRSRAYLCLCDSV